MAPRPTGGGTLLASDSAQFKRFIAGLDTFSTTTNEYQRTDVAPKDTLGNGRLDAADQQQIDNYIAGLDLVRPGGGPTGPIAAAFFERARSDKDLAESRGRVYRIVSASGVRGSEVIVSIELEAKGNETGMSFTLRFDPSKLSFLPVGGTDNNPDVTYGSGSPVGMSRTLNATQAKDGRLGILLGAPSTFEAGTRQILNLRFRVLADAAHGSVELTFDDDLLARSTTNADAHYLDAVYRGGEITIVPSRGDDQISWMSPASRMWPAF